MSLTIRTATVDDAATVALLFTEFNTMLGADGLSQAEAFLPHHVQVSPEQMQSRLSQITGIEKVLVAYQDDEPAGLAALRLVPYVGQDAPYAELTQLFVRQTFQRRGVGAALIEAVERLALDAGATCVHIITGAHNLAAQAFYRTRGYSMPGVVFEKFVSLETANA